MHRIQTTIAPLLILFGLFCNCQYTSGDPDQSLEMLSLLSLTSRCSAPTGAVILASDEIYELNMDSESYQTSSLTFYGYYPGPYMISLAPDGSAAALSYSDGFYSGNPSVHFYFAEGNDWHFASMLDSPDTDFGAFRFHDSLNGLLAAGDASDYDPHFSSLLGDYGPLFSASDPIFAPLQTDGNGVFLEAQTGGDIGLFQWKDNVLNPVFSQTGLDVQWFTASRDGSVIAFLVTGGSEPVLKIKGGTNRSYVASDLGLSYLTVAFDLTADGRYLVYQASDDSIVARNIVTGEVSQVSGSLPAEAAFLEIPCYL
jgi:hypothetical protein|tara:strand:- start:40 stop:978 length:939 start_codon:yes stop_codon:yes gene_type:complete